MKSTRMHYEGSLEFTCLYLWWVVISVSFVQPELTGGYIEVKSNLSYVTFQGNTKIGSNKTDGCLRLFWSMYHCIIGSKLILLSIIACAQEVAISPYFSEVNICSRDVSGYFIQDRAYKLNISLYPF